MYVMSQFKSLEKNIGRKKQSTKPSSQFNLGMLIWAPPQHPSVGKFSKGGQMHFQQALIL